MNGSLEFRLFARTASAAALIALLPATLAHAGALTEGDNGWIGIGTTEPAATLDVRGNLLLDSGINPYLYTSKETTEQNRYLFILNSPSLQSASGLKAGGLLVSDSYRFANPGKNELVVKGAVGIGTPSPATTLHVVGDGSKGPLTVEDSQGRGYISTGLHTGYYGTVGKVTLANRLTVDTDGPEGGNGTVLQTPIHGETFLPSSYDYYPGQFIIMQKDKSYGLLVSHAAGGNSYFNGTGNVGIGTNAPSQKLEVAGKVKATSFITSSDRRLKKDIETSEGLAVVQKLRGVRYRLRASGERDSGVIAQEVEAVLPELVVTDEKTGMKAVKYQSLLAPVIEGVKELAALARGHEGELEKLRSENRALRADNQAMRERLDAIERRLAGGK